MPLRLLMLLLLLLAVVMENAGTNAVSSQRQDKHQQKQQQYPNQHYTSTTTPWNADQSYYRSARDAFLSVPQNGTKAAAAHNWTIKSQQNQQQPSSSSSSSSGRNKPKQPNRKSRVEGQVAAAKTRIIQEFVRNHGNQIRGSRRHADLFDGGGEMIDHVEELAEFESRAEQHRKEQKRQKRSIDKNKDRPVTEDNSEADLPEFASLSEALDHLNGYQQANIETDGFNLRFVHTEPTKTMWQEQKKPPPAQKRRQRRSLKDDDDDDEDEGERHQEAADSLTRLDKLLAELGQHLDEQAIEGTPFPSYYRSMRGAHKGLVQLRDVAQAMMAKQQKEKKQREQNQQQQSGEEEPVVESPTDRMHSVPQDRSPVGDAAADDQSSMASLSRSWQIEAGTLKEHVRQLDRLYRQMDEL